MRKKIAYEESSGNVFADIGLPNAEEHLIKAQLVFKIDLAQPDISKMVRGDFRGTANAFSRRSRAGRRYRSETPSRQTDGSAASRGRCTEGGLVSKPINRGPGAAASGPIADVGRVERFVRP